MAAKKKPVVKLDLAAAGIAADEVGVPAATTAVVGAAVRPPRSAGVKVTDEGEGGVSLAAFLSAQKFI
jgi:electron transfer flavoprotein beta subunit